MLMSGATASNRASAFRCGCCSRSEKPSFRGYLNQPRRERALPLPMSVYTTVTAPELDSWLSRYAVGSLVEMQPIAAGIENTNYFVTTSRGRYVLTLYERLPAEELPF